MIRYQLVNEYITVLSHASKHVHQLDTRHFNHELGWLLFLISSAPLHVRYDAHHEIELTAAH